MSIANIASRLSAFLDRNYRSKGVRIPGRLGDGTDEKRVQVTGAPDLVFFRPSPYQNALWRVVHRQASIPLWHDYPVIVEQQENGEWEVVNVDWAALAEQPDIALRYIATHARQHIINEEHVPDDPVWVYRRAIVNLRAGPPDDSSFRVYVSNGELPWGEHFAGDYGPDLSSYIPEEGKTRWITHYIEPGGTVSIIVGEEFSTSGQPPLAPEGSCPVVFVRLEHDTSSITEKNCYDARMMWGQTGWYAKQAGQVLFSTDGQILTAQSPLLGEGGWLMTWNDDEQLAVLLVVDSRI